MRYGFIGMGNMASAIVKGMLQNSFTGEEFICYDTNRLQLENFCKQYGMAIANDYETLINASKCVVLAVKPNVLPKLLPQISYNLRQKMPLIVSIAAGKTIAEIETMLGFKAPIVRVMPNMNAAVNASMTAVCFNELVSEEQKKIALDCIGSIGICIDIEESYFSIFSAIAGCSPAFTYIYIDSLAKAAHRAGIKKQDAVRVAAQAVFGSAKMMLMTDEHPDSLADKVCSPGGTTIEGVCSLEENGFRSTVIKAVEAAYQKDLKL